MHRNRALGEDVKMKNILYLGDNSGFFPGLTKENVGYKLHAVETVEAAASAIASDLRVSVVQRKGKVYSSIIRINFSPIRAICL